MSYGSIYMSIGWNGLRMPTEGCSVHMPISLLILRSGVVK